MEDAVTTQARTGAGRSFGAILFSVFGAAWITLGLYAFGRLHVPVFLVVVSIVAIGITLALRLLARTREAAKREAIDPQRKRDDRIFAWINAAQGLAIFLLLATLPRLGHQDIAFAAAVVVVGLHFLVMPPTYRSRSNLLLGAAMTVWGLLCMVLFRGDRMIAFAATGAGLMLWAAAADALHTASSIARRLAFP